MIRCGAAFLMTAFVAGAGTFVVADGSLAPTLAAARAGDTVLLVGPVVIRGPVRVDRAIHLRGTNQPVVDGGGSGSCMVLEAAGATVDGFVIRGSGTNLADGDAAVRVSAPGCAVRGCRIEGAGFGIYLRGADQAEVLDNRIQGVAEIAVARRGNGIHLWKTRGARIARNEIRTMRDGIYLSYADGCELTANQVEDCRFGVHSMYSHRNRLEAGTLTGNSVGVVLMFGRQWRVEANRVVDNRRHGLLLKQVENSLIRGNEISGHNRGLFVQQAVQNRFEGNWIATNGIGLYLSGGSEENVFTGNAFVRNADQVWQPTREFNGAGRTANHFSEGAQGNFWSDYTGEDRDGNGIGETPYHETDVFGYLLDRHPEARLLASSPAVSLLRRAEELLPLIETGGVTDLHPLMKPSHLESRREPGRTPRLSGPPAAGAPTCSEAGAFFSRAHENSPIRP